MTAQRRPVAGHVVLAMLGGGLAGAMVAVAGSVVALVLRHIRSGPPGVAAWWGMPATLGLLGAALGVVAGILVGLGTIGLRAGADQRTRRRVAAAVAVVFGAIGGWLLSLFWMGAAEGPGIVVVPAAIVFSVWLAYRAGEKLLARLVPDADDGWRAGQGSSRLSRCRSGHRGRGCHRRPGATAPSDVPW